MVGDFGPLAEHLDRSVAVLIYRVASRLIYGFAVFHAEITAAQLQVPRLFQPGSARRLLGYAEQQPSPDEQYRDHHANFEGCHG